MVLLPKLIVTWIILLTPQQLSDGWIMLFDGKTTYGWQAEGPSAWGVSADGILVAEAGGKLVSTTRFPAGKLTYLCREFESESSWEAVSVDFPGGFVTLAAEKPTEFKDVFYKPEGLQELFNGENLDNWNQYPEMAGKFSADAENRRLVVKDGPGMLETKEAFDDFLLQTAVFTAEDNLNSGIFFRCIPGEKMNGYESQIHNGFKDGDRSQPVDAGTGAIYRRTVARYVPAGDKELFYKTLIVDGPHISVWVNGLQVTDWIDTRKPHANPRNGLRLEAGTIMLQAHDPTTDVYFQDMKIRAIK